MVNKLTAQLVNNLHYSEELAKWAVHSWMFILIQRSEQENQTSVSSSSPQEKTTTQPKDSVQKGAGNLPPGEGTGSPSTGAPPRNPSASTSAMSAISGDPEKRSPDQSAENSSALSKSNGGQTSSKDNIQSEQNVPTFGEFLSSAVGSAALVTVTMGILGGLWGGTSSVIHGETWESIWEATKHYALKRGIPIGGAIGVLLIIWMTMRWIQKLEVKDAETLGKRVSAWNRFVFSILLSIGNVPSFVGASALFDSHFSSDALEALLLAVGIGLVFAIFVFFLQKCPSCRAAWAKEYSFRETLSERIAYRTVTRNQRTTQIQVLVVNYLQHYKCRICGHPSTKACKEEYENFD